MKLLPVALKVENQKCLVVGGGKVAARKVQSLLECGARVHVVAPQICVEIEPLLPQLEYSRHAFQSDDCDDCILIFACTNDRKTNAQIAQIAAQKNLWCNMADDGDASTLHVAAAVRREEICVGITTSGASPALAKDLKSKIENCIGEEYALLLKLMGVRRESLKSEIENQSARAGIWRAILDSEVLDLLRNGKVTRAEEIIDELTQRQSSIQN